MEFTGERLVPTVPGYDDLFLEHISRYVLASALVGDARVLDAGCGCGYGSYHLARRGARSVLGIDSSAEAIEYCRRTYGKDGPSFEVADVCETGLAPGSFDVVVSFELIEHLPEPEVFLVEMRRIMKTSGVFIVSTPNADTYAPDSPDGKNPYHFHEYSLTEFDEVLSRHFSVVRYYAQSWSRGLLIAPLREASTTPPGADLRLVPPPNESTWGEPRPAATSLEKCAFVVALCFPDTGTTAPRLGAQWYAMSDDLGADRNLVRERDEVIRRLQTEIQAQAEDFKREIGSLELLRDQSRERIAALIAEIEKLRQQKATA